MDAKQANMSRKQLNSLSLSWDRNEEFELQENVGEILEALQPDTQQLQIQTKNERATNWNDNISHRGLSEKRIPCSLIALGIKIERQSKQKLIEFARELRSFPSIDMSGSELQENVEEILEVLKPDTQQLQSLIGFGYKGAQFP
ncbi:hypothetical protein JHK85_000367 [Glycine max]|nr:hypothetical protein JHK85_000367 [Glycine max]